jgi:hypothetical protein
MSHLGSITGHEPTVGSAAVAVVKSLGTNTLLVSAMGSVLKLASDTTLPMGVRSLAALVTCAIASVIVVYVYRQERGQKFIGSRAHGKGRTKRARGRPAPLRLPLPRGRSLISTIGRGPLGRDRLAPGVGQAPQRDQQRHDGDNEGGNEHSTAR